MTLARELAQLPDCFHATNHARIAELTKHYAQHSLASPMSFGVVPEEHQRDALMAYNSAKSGLNGYVLSSLSHLSPTVANRLVSSPHHMPALMPGSHAPSSSSHAMSTSTRLNATDRRDFTNAFYLENGKVYGLFKRGKYLLNYDEVWSPPETQQLAQTLKCGIPTGRAGEDGLASQMSPNNSKRRLEERMPTSYPVTPRPANS